MWEGTSASAGASFSVGIRVFEMRIAGFITHVGLDAADVGDSGPAASRVSSVPPRTYLGQFEREFREYLLVDEGWECEVANLIKGATERE
jgi:hypothetical protein